MRENPWLVSLITVLVVGADLCVGHAVPAAEEGPERLDVYVDSGPRLTEPIEIAMKEVPVRGPTRAISPGGVRYLSGQIAACDEVPREAVKAYPEFVWKRPMYGRVRFGAGAATSEDHVIQPGGVTEFHFALDASNPPEETRQAKGAPIRRPLVFDKLYFDANQDLDLTNDPVLELTRGSSASSGRLGTGKTLVFEDLVLPFDFGSQLGRRPVRLTPRSAVCTTLTIGHLIHFLPKASRRGTFELDGHGYVAQIQQNDVIYGRFDRPRVYLDISPARGSGGGAAVAWGNMGNWHRIGNQYCTIHATPMGDRLTIAPHLGNLGTIEFGERIRVSECTLTSALANLPIVRPQTGRPSAAPLEREFRVPVGDYGIQSLSASCGRVRIRCRPLTTDGTAHEGAAAEYPVKIRAGQPYRFELSDKKAVAVLDQTESKVFKRGEFARIRPALTLPAFGLSLHTSYMVIRARDGKPSEKAPPSHHIVIRNARGEVVGEADMRMGYFPWHIPKDLELAAEKETFSASVTFQTHDLYGPVEATFPIVVGAK
jgi:hypothetical protein